MPAPDILCIGSVLWDIIGRSPTSMRLGSDVPGRITRLPGGVAMNIAMTLRRFGLTPGAAVRHRPRCRGRGTGRRLRRGWVLSRTCSTAPHDLPTDRYMAIEGANGLIAAVADAHSLEAAGPRILTPLGDGRLGSRRRALARPHRAGRQPDRGAAGRHRRLASVCRRRSARRPRQPRQGGTPAAAARPSRAPRFTSTSKRRACCARPASPARPRRPRALLARGAARVLVTDGGNTCCRWRAGRGRGRRTPRRRARDPRHRRGRHLHGRASRGRTPRGRPRRRRLHAALRAAADYVSGDIGS